MTNLRCLSLLFLLVAGKFFCHAADVPTPPAITVQPASQIVACEDDVTFSVTATGSEPLAYFWTADGQPLGMPVTSSNVTLTNILFGSGTRFTVVVSNAFGMVASEPAILTVTGSPQPDLTISGDGQSGTVVSWPHTCAPFTLHSTPALSDAITNWIAVSAALKVDELRNYVNVTTNEANFYWLFTLLPGIATQPLSQTRTNGASASFSVVATNPPSKVSHPLFYQWRLNGIALLNETNSTLNLTDIKARNGGTYDVVVANDLNAAVSQGAALKVTAVEFELSDSFGNRATTNSFSNAINGSNVGATKEPFEPNHAGILGGKSVWMEWMAPSNGIATFDTQGSGFDTVLAVYSGTTITNLVLVTSDDDSGGFYTSRVQFNAVAGSKYEIAIDGLAGSSGQISLNWNLEVTDDQIPQIIQQPQSQTALLGSNAVFSITVDPKFPPLTYQWKTNGVSIQNNPTATTSSLVISNAQIADVAAYTVVVSNTVRAVESTVAYLDLEQRTGANVFLPFTPEPRFKDKLEVRFDAPSEGNGLLNVRRAKKRVQLDLAITSGGSITVSTANGGLTQGWDSTVCNYAVSGTLYVDLVPRVNATVMILDTQQSAPVDTILKVRLPNGASPWTDDIFYPFNRQSQIYVQGILGGYTYPVTIGRKLFSPSGPVTLTVSLF